MKPGRLVFRVPGGGAVLITTWFRRWQHVRWFYFLGPGVGSLDPGVLGLGVGAFAWNLSPGP